MNKIQYVQATEYYSAIKMNEVPIHAKVWMNYGSKRLRERTRHKTPLEPTPFAWSPLQAESRISGYQGLRKGRLCITTSWIWGCSSDGKCDLEPSDSFNCDIHNALKVQFQMPHDYMRYKWITTTMKEKKDQPSFDSQLTTHPVAQSSSYSLSLFSIPWASRQSICGTHPTCHSGGPWPGSCCDG